MSGHEKKLRTEIKQTIVWFKNEGHSGRKIGKLLDIEPSTINKFLKRYNERGDVENKHWSGRPRKCNDRTDRHLIRVVKINRRKTLQNITATLNEGTPVKISHSTVRRRLSFFGYKRRIVKKENNCFKCESFQTKGMVQVKATLHGWKFLEGNFFWWYSNCVREIKVHVVRCMYGEKNVNSGLHTVKDEIGNPGR